MSCTRCRTPTPPEAYFCHRCGWQLHTADGVRRSSYAARPDRPVASFAPVTTLMPRGVGRRPQTYRSCLIVALTVALLAAVFGWLPIAVLVAAFAVPLVYLVHLYDVNAWEDQPVAVVVLAYGLTGALAAAFTVGWLHWRGPDLDGGRFGGVGAAPVLGPALVAVVLVPVVATVITQLGPLLLIRRPAFDDLLDGLTFGVVAGLGYATADTLVKHATLLAGGGAGWDDPVHWTALVFVEGFVKPLVFGTAAGLAAAEFSGLGHGYDGFTARYARGLAEALVALVAFQAGSYFLGLLGRADVGVVLTALWGLAILAVLVIRLRTVLHTALLEAALERSAEEAGASGTEPYCALCELPLLPHAAFCSACGAAVRVRPKPALAGVVAVVSSALAVGPPAAGATGTPPPEHSIPTPPRVGRTVR